MPPNCVMSEPVPDEGDVTEDALLGGALRLRQPRRGHRAGTDAVLLAGLCGEGGIGPGETVVDLGSASGAVGLMVALRHPGARVVLADRDPMLVELARQNIMLNAVADRATSVEAEVFASRADRVAAGLASGSADLVVTNPPFFEAGTARMSPDPGRRAAHAMAGGDLAGWIEAAADLLKPRGRLAMIHRADELATCLAALGRRFGGLRIVPVQARAGNDAIRILVTAVKGGRGPLAIAPALVLHEPDGGFTPDALRLHAL